ncbi:MAG: double-strand break repair helicase AddA [Rhodospirillales bacterium]|nr:double-strand break repair helicase AddA [Rhodospirillales bacterium]
MNRFADPQAMQRRALEPAASVWVAASAGTGKTKVLTDRVLRLMVEGTPPQRILCLTFTRAAAANMANRIADALGTWAADGDRALARKLEGLLGRAPTPEIRTRARRLFADVLDLPGGMQIETIHAFCQSLLGRFPLEAGVAPHFATMEERDAEEMLGAAREEVLSRARGSGSDGDLSAALARVTVHVHEETFAELMSSLAASRGRLRRLLDKGDIAGAARTIRKLLGLRAADRSENALADASADAAFDALGLKLAIQALNLGSESDGDRAFGIAAWLELPAEDRVRTFRKYASCYLTSANPPDVRKVLITKDAAAQARGAAEILKAEAERLRQALLRFRAAVTAEATEALLVLAAALMGAYDRQKSARALLDYDDLILKANELLARPGVAPWVLFKLDGGIDHILIDEAQDTAPGQWQVVEALAAEFFAGQGAREGARTVFAVGDRKQSIYSFQGADPAGFLAMQERFGARANDAGQPWREVDLTTSYRSVPAVLSAIDAVFAQPQAAVGVAFDDTPIHHEAWRSGAGGLVELWPPVVPKATDPPPPWKPPVERFEADSPQARLANLIAKRIRRMIQGREILESQGRPIRAGDIMVLVRRRTVFVEDLVRALKEQRVAVAGVDRMVLTEQMAVMDLVALGRFLLLPGDDLTLATVLKGPLIGLDEDALFRLAYNRSGTLWQSLREKAADEPAFGRACAELSDLLARADYSPPFEFFSHVLGARRGREKLLARLGLESEDPIAEFLDLALTFERAHPASLEGFLHWLEAGAVEVKRELEESREDAVRVITVHGAKGLEAPIVFLPDTLQVPSATPPLLWPGVEGGGEVLLWPPSRDCCEEVATAEIEQAKQRRDAEYRRLLYVAMTRAADRLYICGWQGKKAPPAGCWYDLVRDGLQGIAEKAEDPFLAAEGETAGATVLRVASAQTAAPAAAATENRPHALEDLPPWARKPPAAEPRPPRPLTPSRPEDAEPAVRSPLGPDRGARFKRGLVIHRLLQLLPQVPATRRAAAAKDWLARPVLGLPKKLQAEIAAETLAVLGHPEFAPLFGEGSRAEVPLAGVVGGHVVAGQVDRLRIGATEVDLVDYKTSRTPPADEGAIPVLYLRQMAAYRSLLRPIFPTRAVRCHLLWTEGPRLMRLSDEVLNPYAL